MPSQRSCILCFKVIGDRTAPEHILLNALGGRFTSNRIICSVCNHEMGIGPDRDLVESVSFLRNIAGLKAGDGGQAEIIRNPDADGLKYALLPGGQPQIRSKTPLTVTQESNGIKVVIEAFSEAEADKLIEGAARKIAKMLGQHQNEIVIEAIKKGITKDRKNNLITAPSVRGQLQFGQGRSKQSMAKSAFVLWAKLVGNTECTLDTYNTIRTFIGSDEVRPEHQQVLKLDHRRLPTTLPQFGSNPNLIWAGSDSNGQVTGYFRLYNIIGWQFSLGTTSKFPNRQICLISNPFENEIKGLFTDAEVPVCDTFFQATIVPNQPDYASINIGMNDFAKQAASASLDQSLVTMTKEALAKTGLNDGDLIQKEHLEILSQQLSERLAFMIAREPRSTQE